MEALAERLGQGGEGSRAKSPVGVSGFNLVMWNGREREDTQEAGHELCHTNKRIADDLTPRSLGQPYPGVPGGLNRVYTRLLTVGMSFSL